MGLKIEAFNKGNKAKKKKWFARFEVEDYPCWAYWSIAIVVLIILWGVIASGVYWMTKLMCG